MVKVTESHGAKSSSQLKNIKNPNASLFSVSTVEEELLTFYTVSVLISLEYST